MRLSVISVSLLASAGAAPSGGPLGSRPGNHLQPTALHSTVEGPPSNQEMELAAPLQLQRHLPVPGRRRPLLTPSGGVAPPIVSIAAPSPVTVAGGVIALGLTGLLSILALLPLTVQSATGRRSGNQTESSPLTEPTPPPDPEPVPVTGAVFCTRAGTADGCPSGQYCTRTRGARVFVCAWQKPTGALCYFDYQCRSGHCAPSYPIGRCL